MYSAERGNRTVRGRESTEKQILLFFICLLDREHTKWCVGFLSFENHYTTDPPVCAVFREALLTLHIDMDDFYKKTAFPSDFDGFQAISHEIVCNIFLTVLTSTHLWARLCNISATFKKIHKWGRGQDTCRTTNAGQNGKGSFYMNSRRDTWQISKISKSETRKSKIAKSRSLIPLVFIYILSAKYIMLTPYISI